MKKLLLLLLVGMFSSCELGTTSPSSLFDCEILYKDHSQVIQPHSSIFVYGLLLESGKVVDTNIVNNSDTILVIPDPVGYKNNATSCPEPIEVNNYFAFDFTEVTILVSVKKSDFDSQQDIINKMLEADIITEDVLTSQNWAFSSIDHSLFEKISKKVETFEAKDITYIRVIQ